MSKPLQVLAPLAMPAGWCKITRRGTRARSSSSTRNIFFVACTRGASRVQSKLADLVEQRLVTDSQHLGCIFSAPMSFFESVRDRFHLGFVLQTAHERFQPLLARGHGFFSRRNALARRGHFQQLAE